MTKIKYINTDVFKYVPIEDAFNECTRITNLKTGVTESLSPADKQFYVRMRHRYYRFAIELGGTYYDDIDQLGASIGVSSATATRIVAKLKKIGLIASNKPKRSNQWTITPLTPENFTFERDRNAMERDSTPEWVDCLKHPVFGKAKEDVAPEVEEENQQPVPEEAKADPKPEKPKQMPTKKPASIPAKGIKIEPVNLNFLDSYRDEWENPDKNLPVSQHPKIRWMLINGYLDYTINPKLKSIYEEIEHLC
ncbi:TPA: ArsR family transcriptional regulator [Klebsiella pneumoniae]|uniref:ArsR family transcriptional regulator n=1 Tax=Klebsiella pneumoniae TaxID=573 RepID=UPI0028CD67D3|nr:ArsR family transcriptional regulator [Klebsiella pneumoniae]HDY9197834.1 ArsR family transcriptional regulator [Klebsiella pneumoniae]